MRTCKLNALGKLPSKTDSVTVLDFGAATADGYALTRLSMTMTTNDHLLNSAEVRAFDAEMRLSNLPDHVILAWSKPFNLERHHWFHRTSYGVETMCGMHRQETVGIGMALYHITPDAFEMEEGASICRKCANKWLQVRGR